MCRIVGICEADPAASVDRALLARATVRLSHRGPDGERLLVRGPVGLGHRRLSISDLIGGAQPVFKEDAFIAVVDGVFPAGAVLVLRSSHASGIRGGV